MSNRVVCGKRKQLTLARKRGKVAARDGEL
jgi:hypothetical protein